MPAARLVEREIVLFAEQDREAHRLVGAHGLDCGIKGEAGIAAAAAVLAGHDAADAADMDLVGVPVDGAEIDADMAGEPALGRIDQHAQVGVRPFDVAPRQLPDDLPTKDRVVQGLGPVPGGFAIEDVDFEAHWGTHFFRICGV